MDEKRLAELFRDAVADAPPPSFDEHDVAEASRRATARRRSVLAGGSALAVVALAIVGAVVGLGTFGHTGSSDSAGSALAGSATSTTRRPFDAKHSNNFPEIPPLQGGGPTGRAGSSTGSAPGGCGPADGKLAAALAGELSSAGDTTTQVATTPPVACPTGSSSAAYQVRDGSVTGTVSVLVVGPGYPVDRLGAPSGSVIAHEPTRAGHEIVVISTPALIGPVPFADRVDAMAKALAARF